MKRTLAIVLLVLMLLVSCTPTEEHIHSFGEWETVKESTCIEKGSRQRLCQCGEKETEELELAEHTYSEWVKTNDTHERKCTVCNSEEKGEHVMESGKTTCSVCKFGYRDATPYTPQSGDEAVVENLGEFTKTTYIRMNDGGYRKDGTPVIYFVGDGIPNAMFVMAEAETGKLLVEKKLEFSQGAWEVFVHSSKDVYIVAHGTPYLYVFDHETEEIRNIGALPNGSTLGQVMCETKDGRIFSGSTDSGQFWGYNPKTGKFINIAALIPNATRYPAVAYDPVEDKLYVSIISKDSKNYLFRVDPNTFAREDITPSAYKNNAKYQFYDMKVFGDILFIRYPSTQETLFLNIRTNKLVAFNKAGGSGNPQMIKTYCRQPAADPENSKNFYTVMENQLALFDTEKLTYTLTGVSCPNNQMIRMVMLKLNSDKYTGYSACSIYSHKGQMQFSNFDTKRSIVFNTTFEGSPNDINCLTITEAGKIIIGGGYGGSTGVLDLKSGRRLIHQGIGQQEGIMAYGNKVFIGSYPNANIVMVDTAFGWTVQSVLNMHYNNNVSGYHNQDRPYTFLPIYEKEIMAIGAIPAQSFNTGAIALIDANNNKVLYFDKFPIAGHSAASMVYTNDKLYIGTTTTAGYGTDEIAFQAVLMSLDLDTKEYKTYNLPCAAGAVTALTVDNDGKIWGMAYNQLFSFDPVSEDFDYLFDTAIHSNNQAWREFKISMGADGSCLFISGAISQDLFRFDLNTKKLELMAENVGWYHIMDNYGNFYLMKGTELNKVSFKH